MRQSGAARLSWSQVPREKGLAGVAGGSLGWRLRLGNKELARVSPNGGGGFYWYSLIGSEPMNTYTDYPYHTVEDAKNSCLRWVQAQRVKS